MAATLARAGSRVVLTDVDPEAGAALVERIAGETGGQVRFEGIEALIAQMDADVAATRVALAEHPCA